MLSGPTSAASATRFHVAPPQQRVATRTFWITTACTIGFHVFAVLFVGILLAARTDQPLSRPVWFLLSLPFAGFNDGWGPLAHTQWASVFIMSATATLLAYAVAKRSTAAMVAAGVAALLYGAWTIWLIALIF